MNSHEYLKELRNQGARLRLRNGELTELRDSLIEETIDICSRKYHLESLTYSIHFPNSNTDTDLKIWDNGYAELIED